MKPQTMATRGKQPKDTDLAYFAGLVDGEGTIGIYRRVYKEKPNARPVFRERLTISNSNLKVLEYMAEFFPGIVCKNTRYSDKHAPMFRLEFHARQAAPVLRQLLPYLRIKKEQARLVIQFRDTLVFSTRHNPVSDEEFDRRELYYFELKNLNLRGRRAAAETKSKDIQKDEVIVRSA